MGKCYLASTIIITIRLTMPTAEQRHPQIFCYACLVLEPSPLPLMAIGSHYMPCPCPSLILTRMSLTRICSLSRSALVSQHYTYHFPLHSLLRHPQFKFNRNVTAPYVCTGKIQQLHTFLLRDASVICHHD